MKITYERAVALVPRKERVHTVMLMGGHHGCDVDRLELLEQLYLAPEIRLHKESPCPGHMLWIPQQIGESKVRMYIETQEEAWLPEKS